MLNVNKKSYGPFDLFYYGCMDCVPGWRTSYDSGDLEGIVIHYVKSGKGVFRTPDNKYEIGANTAFIMHPENKYYYVADQLDPWKYMWVCIGGDYVNDQILSRKRFVNTPVIKYKEINAIKNCFDNLFNYMPKNNMDDELFYSGIINLLLYYTFMGDTVDLVCQQVSKSDNNINNERKYINDATGYITVNYHRNITINDIAEHVGLNRSYFSKLFRKCTGYSPNDYLQQYRIEMAIHLLETSDESVKVIADKTGFSYVHYFSKIIKESTGKTPTQYRNDYKTLQSGLKEEKL